jgi:hypothetical protein
MATLRQNTKFYTPRLARAGDDVVGYIHRHPGWVLDKEYPMEVRLPTRNIVRLGSMPRQDEMFSDPSLYQNLDDLMTADGRNFQITYSFPVRTRINIFAGQEYGAPGVTMRQLYDFLCSEYNGGERFVDTYFDYIFPSSPAGRMFAEFRSETARMVNTEYKRITAARVRRLTLAGEADKRTREWRAVKEFRVWRDALFINRLDMLHAMIKREIVQYLSIGKIPLRFTPEAETLAVRMKRGLSVPHGFYASGQLINSLQLSIRIPDSAFRVTPDFQEVPF